MKNIKLLFTLLSYTLLLCTCRANYQEKPTSNNIYCSFGQVEVGDGCFTVHGTINYDYTSISTGFLVVKGISNQSYVERELSLEIMDVHTYSFEAKITDLDEGTYSYYIKLYSPLNKERCLYVSATQTVTVQTVKPVLLVEGELIGLFSVSSYKKVRFSKGNLEYSVNNGGFYFHDEQYYRTSVTNNENIDLGFRGWIDLLGYGTSGNLYNPLESGNSKYNYAFTSINDTYNDWGKSNAIKNGGNVSGIWRTLRQDEWAYVVSREGKSGRGRVGDVNGLVLLPDVWQLPNGLSFTPMVYHYSDNAYTISQWKQMEEAGAVFLPCCGYRIANTVYDNNSVGSYWSATWRNSETLTDGSQRSAQPYFLYFSESQFFNNAIMTGTSDNYNSYGRSVRLVHDCPQ